jgi:hypothetical protein
MSFDVEALLLILGFAAVLGTLLSLPMLWLVRRSRRENGRIARSRVLTPIGKAVSFFEAAVLMYGFALPYFQPDAPLAIWLSSWQGKASAVLVFWIATIPLEAALARMGHPTMRPQHHDIDDRSNASAT